MAGYANAYSLAAGKIPLGNAGGTVAHVTPTGDITISSAGVTAIGANKVTAAMLGANLGLGMIDLPLTNARELATNASINGAGNGGLLASDTTPIFDVTTSAKEFGLTWATNNVDELVWTFTLPPDFDVTATCTLKVYGKRGHASDAGTMTCQVFNGVNGTDAGGATSALGTSLTIATKTIAANTLSLATPNVSLCLVPDAHANGAIIVQSVWIEYTRRS